MQSQTMLRKFPQARVQLQHSRLQARVTSRPHLLSLPTPSSSKCFCLPSKTPPLPGPALTSIYRPIWRRSKSSKASKEASGEDTLGDEPPLYDGKPAWWARWAYALVVLDILFTGVTVDMVVNKWTRLEEVEIPPTNPGEEPQKSVEYVLRPLSQRLGLAGFQVLVGSAAAAYILASRDRTVWRMRIKRMSLSPHAPPSRASSRPLAISEPMNVLVLETASGRTKRFRMQDCHLLPGRHLGEFAMRISGIRGQFVISLHRGARILGISTADDSDVWTTQAPTTSLSSASKSKGDSRNLIEHAGTRAQILHPSRSFKGQFGKFIEDGVADLNRKEGDGQSMEDPNGGMSVEAARTAELRRLFGRVWLRKEGCMFVQRDSSQSSGWTEGPATKTAMTS